MIKINTSRFGVLEAEEEKIINFPDGLVGLSDMTRFILIDYKDTPIKWLQSLEDPDIAFIVTSPDTIMPEYSLEPDKTVKQYLQLEDNDDIVVLIIMRVQGNDVIANFQGPLLLNARNKRGVQIILDFHNKAYQKIG
ncbi:MAG: flagellar assembly protein FliW [Nitrospirae bacterium]|nr:flagellar assembly protein FliW [Nitrospirota bacterium]